MKPALIFFDNICVLCSWSVRLVYRFDRKGRFHFASTDSELFQKTIGESCPSLKSVDSVILFMDEHCYVKSTAFLKIAYHLRFPFPLLIVGYLLPPFIRDAIYDLIARKRYQWFGKKDQCFVPEAGLRERFQD